MTLALNSTIWASGALFVVAFVLLGAGALS